MSTFEIQHFKNQELAKAYMQGVHDITEWLLKPSERTATNFDKITVSPEELGEFLLTFHLNGCGSLGLWEAREDGLCAKDIPCEECLTQWLKQEMRDKE